MIKLIELDKDTIVEQLKSGVVSSEAIAEYLVNITHVYNKLIDRIVELESKHE